MRNLTSLRALLVGLAVSALMLLSGGIAMAAEGDTIPHGGYNTSTDACLQCHDIHQAAGDYVLARWPTITAVCGSCHTLYQQAIGSNLGTSGSSGYVAGASAPDLATSAAWAIRWDGDRAGLAAYGDEPTAANLTAGGSNFATATAGDMSSRKLLNYNPGYGGLEAPVPGWSAASDPANQMGNGAPFEVYQESYITRTGSDGLRGHRLGTSFTLGQQINHADGVTDALDYIPGSSGRLTAIKTPSIGGSAGQAGYGYMLPTASVSEFPVSLNGGLYCASCHTPHAQFSGQGYDGTENNSNMISYQVIDKLLSKRPNHSGEEANLDPNNGDQWVTDGGREYCGKCHDQRLSNVDGEDPHNHPDFACLQCHGNESVISPANVADTSANLDFPHTSANPNLLTQEPDGLCINCHAPGALPLP